MTLCIAAICRQENRQENQIVTVTDFLLSDEETSIETRFLKVQKVGATGKWLQLFAGDPSHFIAIAANAKRKLADTGNESFEEVIRAYQEAVQEEKHKKIEDTVLSKYGLTLKNLLLRENNIWANRFLLNY